MIRLIVLVTAVVIGASLAGSTANCAEPEDVGQPAHAAPDTPTADHNVAPSAEEAARIVAATRVKSTVAPAGSECSAAGWMTWVDYHGYRLVTRHGSTQVERILREDSDGTVHTQGPDGDYTYGPGDPMPFTSPDGSVENMQACPG